MRNIRVNLKLLLGNKANVQSLFWPKIWISYSACFCIIRYNFISIIHKFIDVKFSKEIILNIFFCCKICCFQIFWVKIIWVQYLLYYLLYSPHTLMQDVHQFKHSYLKYLTIRHHIRKISYFRHVAKLELKFVSTHYYYRKLSYE